MALDIKRHREKIKGAKPEFNLVPFIDVLFTLLIFLVVSTNFSGAEIAEIDGGAGKPNITDTTGDSEYYLLPVSGLEKVIVNGQDMSSLIKRHAIAVQTRVIDEGEINIRPREKSIIITTPPGMSPEQAVRSPD